MIKLILPKNNVTIPFTDNVTRLYFTLGPIRGAFDWQTKAIKMLQKKDPGCYIACPCRWKEDHELFRFSIPDNSDQPTNERKMEVDGRIEVANNLLAFPHQTAWERYYLQLASYYGSIIAWLPAEDSNNRRKWEDGPYGQDSYGELGRWSIRSAEKISLYDSGTSCARVNLAVGAEKDFFGLKVIQRNFDADHGKPYLIYSTLEQTVDAAIALAKKPIHRYANAEFSDENK